MTDEQVAGERRRYERKEHCSSEPDEPARATQPPKPIPKTAADFCREYVPLSYAVDQIVRSRSVYTLTAKTGAGKTALMVAIALAVATGRKDILEIDVEKGSVIYLAFENPDDLRMRLMIAATTLGIDFEDLGRTLLILDARAKPEKILETLRILQNQPLALILADTFAAWFDGEDINDNVQGGEFVRRARALTSLPGNPTLIIAAHPIKSARDDQLVPYGGGAILNEVDGNLTLNRVAGIVSLHWQGKLRGVEFERRQFRFKISHNEKILDAKGREVSLPVIVPASDVAVETHQAVETDLNTKLLQAMLAKPDGSQADWGMAIGGKDKSIVNRRLQKLKSEKLAESLLGRWRVTSKGVKALKPPTK
jgi:hypothetical protein